MQLQKWIEKNTEFQADGSVMVICGQRPLTPSQPSSLVGELSVIENQLSMGCNVVKITLYCRSFYPHRSVELCYGVGARRCKPTM